MNKPAANSRFCVRRETALVDFLEQFNAQEIENMKTSGAAITDIDNRFINFKTKNK